MKNQPRGLEGTFRTAAEMERHRAQLADAAIEEQLEVQTAFREHGARLQVTCPYFFAKKDLAVLLSMLDDACCCLLCHQPCRAMIYRRGSTWHFSNKQNVTMQSFPAGVKA